MDDQKILNESKVREVVCGIPHGRVTTYGDISCLLTGRVDSAQAVGGLIRTLGNRYSVEEVPVHRVVDRDGFFPNKKNAQEMHKEGASIYSEQRGLGMADFNERLCKL